ncbi:MAG: outer membrane protein transport protein, partial [Acidiferrobacterales bacterium]
MNRKILRRVFCPSLAVLLFQFSQSVFAGGLYISEGASPASVGTAGVFNVVNNVEASSAFTNPAGMTGLKEDQTMIGLQLAIPETRFDSSIAEAGGSDGGNAGEVAGIPGFFWVKGMTDKWKLGFSAVAPIGGGVDYGDDFVGRYQTTEAFLSALALSASGGYKLNDDTSIGFGLSAVYQVFELGVAINNRAPLGLPDAKVEIEDADDWGFQPFFGLTHQINDRLMLGFTYRGEFDVDLEGDLKFTNTGPLLNQLSSKVDEATFGLDYVDAYTLGFKYKYRDDLTLFFDVNYETWSDFSENRIDIEGSGASRAVSATIDRNWDDTWHIGFGFARKLGDDRLFTFGVAYDSSPVDDDDRTADLPADEQFKFALGWSKVKPDRVRSIGFTFIHLGDNRIDQTT